MKKQDHYYVPPADSQKVIDREKTIIDDAREKDGLPKSEFPSGLAISGGGIRSASFGMGVMQALVANKQLYKMDYMSTVSGGGYLGSALTWALHQDKDANTSDKFPLGARGSADTPENKRLNFIRQHSSYLLPDNSIGLVSLAGVMLRSMLLSVIVYTAVLTILMTALQWSGFFAFDYGPYFDLPAGMFLFRGFFITFCLFLAGLYFVGMFFYSLGTFFNSVGLIKGYLRFIRGQQAIGIILKLIIALAAIGSVPYIYNLLSDPKTFESWAAEATAGGSTLFGTLVGAWQYMKAQKQESSGGIMSNLLIYVGAAALIYGLLLLAYLTGVEYIHEGWVLALLVCLTVVLGFCVSLNQVGPHRIWRNRLMEAFMPNKEAIETNQWQAATEADTTQMKDMCREKARPYHLVNTNIILVDSPSVKFRGRGGDNFIISREYCGSYATGWRETEKFQKPVTGITLATAMATSAAALNPNAGVSGEGVTRNTVVSILLAILNLRLGYWTVNPKSRLWHLHPNFFVPGLSSEVRRSGLDEDSKSVQLSDGGHFENLAIYELIRRKSKFIVLSDGGADLAFNFDDLANAVEKVRVDFGVKICFRDAQLNAILGIDGTPGPTLFDKKYSIASQGYAIGTIRYPEDPREKPSGVLVYIKLAMIKDLPTDIYSYKGVNPDFPHQSTADQFFNEKQFEAYRELGYNVMWKMMESDDGKILFPPDKKDFGSAGQLGDKYTCA